LIHTIRNSKKKFTLDSYTNPDIKESKKKKNDHGFIHKSGSQKEPRSRARAAQIPRKRKIRPRSRARAAQIEVLGEVKGGVGYRGRWGLAGMEVGEGVEEDADSMWVGRGVEAEQDDDAVHLAGKIKCTVYILVTIGKEDVQSTE
jgi:hypothetical protein